MKNKNDKNWMKIQEETSMLARWMALYEAINYCADKAAEKKIPFNKVNLKPLDIMKYISSTEDGIQKKLLKLDYNIDVHYVED
jgi:hypothetical protein